MNSTHAVDLHDKKGERRLAAFAPCGAGKAGADGRDSPVVQVLVL